MPPKLIAQIDQSWPPSQWQDVTVLVAVSGGADSVALLRALVSLKNAGAGRLLGAHYNHNLRDNESDADEAFVVQLCCQLDIECVVGRCRVVLKEEAGGEGLEAVARNARYEFLQTTAARLGARYLATGHTADDQVETILHRIVRGTGIAGLAGIARCRPLSEATTLIRPMLAVRRAEVVDYLSEIGQPYRTDSSNTDTQFTRNRLRHELLPLLARHYNPAVDQALLRLGGLAGELQCVVDRLVAKMADRAVQVRGGRTLIDRVAIHDEPVYLVRELFLDVWRRREWPQQSMGFAEWDELARMLLDGDPTKKMFPGEILAERTEAGLVLSREGAGPQ